MLPEKRIEKIVQLRRQVLHGRLIDLVPMQPTDTPDVLRLRNSPRAIWAMSQGTPLTPAMHDQWYRGYLERNNDIAWLFRLPSGTIVGTCSLYGIDPEGLEAEKGRCVIEDGAALTAPYAAEADLLGLNVAFEALQLSRVISVIRPENVKVASMHHRIGFRFSHDIELRSTPYRLYYLERANFDRSLLERIITHWRGRNESRAD